jgi:hypothetical protein
MANKKTTWHASETESIEPFRMAEEALSSCSLRLKQSENFDDADTRFIETKEFWTDCAPELQVSFEGSQIVQGTGIELDDLVVAIVLRDRILNRFIKIQEWPGTGVPITPVSLTSGWESISQSDSIDISVLVTPAQTKDRGTGIARHKANVIARKTFKIRSLSQTPSFPYRWVPPEEFEKRSCSRNTIWLLNWLGENFERPIEDSVELLLNEDYRETFEVLEAEGHYSNLFRREMVAAVLAEMAFRVLDSGELPTEESGMRAQILTVLSEASGRGPDEILSMLNRPDKFGVIHAWVQNHVELNEVIRGL